MTGTGADLALIAGEGALPRLIHDAVRPAVLCEMEGHPSGLPHPVRFRIETLGTLIADLQARGIRRVCFAGRVRRPVIDPARIDAATRPLVARMAAALGQGDDGLLRTILDLFAQAGIETVGAQDLRPDLLPPAGIPTRRQPGPEHHADADRARSIHAALSAADLGQACAVAAGQALAVETHGGTDWMLATLARDRPDGPPGGVFYKAPKLGQDLRVDAPTIGVGTVEGVAAAGLDGLVLGPGTLALDLGAIVSDCDRRGLFLWIAP